MRDLDTDLVMHLLHDSIVPNNRVRCAHGERIVIIENREKSMVLRRDRKTVADCSASTRKLKKDLAWCST